MRDILLLHAGINVTTKRFPGQPVVIIPRTIKANIGSFTYFTVLLEFRNRKHSKWRSQRQTFRRESSYGVSSRGKRLNIIFTQEKPSRHYLALSTYNLIYAHPKTTLSEKKKYSRIYYACTVRTLTVWVWICCFVYCCCFIFERRPHCQCLRLIQHRWGNTKEYKSVQFPITTDVILKQLFLLETLTNNSNNPKCIVSKSSP